MPRSGTISYNRYFLVPFIIWVVAGAFIQAVFTQEEIFMALNTHYTTTLDWVMYYITWMGTGQVITTLLLLLMFLKPFRNLWYFVAATCCNLIPFLLQQWAKTYFNTPRPLNYFHHASWIHILPNWDELMNRSFPSGHSEGAFSFFCFLSLILPVRHQKAGLVFAIIALSVCYSRLYLSAHFFEDVYAGSIMGVVLTTIIFSIVKKYRDVLVWPKKRQQEQNA